MPPKKDDRKANAGCDAESMRAVRVAKAKKASAVPASTRSQSIIVTAQQRAWIHEEVDHLTSSPLLPHMQQGLDIVSSSCPMSLEDKLGERLFGASGSFSRTTKSVIAELTGRKRTALTKDMIRLTSGAYLCDRVRKKCLPSSCIGRDLT